MYTFTVKTHMHTVKTHKHKNCVDRPNTPTHVYSIDTQHPHTIKIRANTHKRTHKQARIHTHTRTHRVKRQPPHMDCMHTLTHIPKHTHSGSSAELWRAAVL